MSGDRQTAEDFEIVVDPDAIVAALRDQYEHDRHRNGQKVMTV